MRAISVIMVIILNVQFWKLLDIYFFQSFFPTITRHIENGIWKTPLVADFTGVDQHTSWFFLG